ncbi:MAG: TetR/AcrR family transcriptional regulator [Acidimicrobiales bacterium]|jgi:AcrR family transcriptional regulator
MSERAMSTDPRVAHTRSVVLGATVEILAEEGFERLTVEAVAERSGVARSTIYRNWPERSDLLSDGFDQMCSFEEIPDLGSMDAELRFVATEIANSLAQAQWAKALPSLIGAAHHDKGLTEAQRLFAQRRQALTGVIFERAVERDEIIAGRDPKHLAELFASGFFFRFLMTRAPIDDAFIDAQIEAVIALASHPGN